MDGKEPGADAPQYMPRPMSDDTKAKLREASKAYHRRTGLGTKIGNALSAKAKAARKP
jgi:hypothetical protein